MENGGQSSDLKIVAMSVTLTVSGTDTFDAGPINILYE